MAHVERFEKDEVLIEEGSIEKKFFVLAGGRLGVFKDGKQVSEISGRGAVVGELGVILDQPRTATIKALELSHAVPVDADLDTMVHSHPDVVKAVLVTLAKRLSTTSAELWHLAEDAPVDDG